MCLRYKYDVDYFSLNGNEEFFVFRFFRLFAFQRRTRRELEVYILVMFGIKELDNYHSKEDIQRIDNELEVV